jgi:hypothetical protein
MPFPLKEVWALLEFMGTSRGISGEGSPIRRTLVVVLELVQAWLCQGSTPHPLVEGGHAGTSTLVAEIGAQ